jgi:hypothetical protein
VSLVYTVFDPVETHVDGFGAPLANAVIGYAGGGRVISFDGRGRLRVGPMSCRAVRSIAPSFPARKKRAEFGFGGGGYDSFHDAAECVDGAVVRRIGWFGRVDLSL